MVRNRLLLPLWLLLGALLATAPAAAQDLPALSGRVVDQAELLPPDVEAGIVAKLEALERDTTRQLVVVTVPSLQDYSIEDFGFALGESWKIGNEEADNGVIFLIAPNERRVRIEVGDGVEGILPDAMAWIIIRDRVTPRFREGDMPGGIVGGVDGIIEQLSAPLEVAEERARAAAEQRRGGGGGAPLRWWEFMFGLLFILPFPVTILVIFLLFFAVEAIVAKLFPSWYRRRARKWGTSGGPSGRRKRGDDGFWGTVWEGGSSSSGGSSWGGGSWGGGSSWGGGGGGGFSGGGGSFGGGGASGGW